MVYGLPVTDATVKCVWGGSHLGAAWSMAKATGVKGLQHAWGGSTFSNTCLRCVADLTLRYNQLGYCLENALQAQVALRKANSYSPCALAHVVCF